MLKLEDYLEYLQEANRIIQGISRETGKPQDHIQDIWKRAEKDTLVRRKHGVVDRYRQIGNIVKAKMGVEIDKDSLKEPKVLSKH